MKNLTTIIIAILCAYLSPDKALSASDDHKMSYILPINHYDESDPTSLTVKAPVGYRALQDLGDSINGRLLEYIPQGDDALGWSSIFTIHPLIGNGVQANEYIEALTTGIQSNSQKSEVLERDFEKGKNYSKSSVGISYVTLKGRSEVVYVVAYSGPADLAAVQYATVLKLGQNPKEVFAQLKQKAMELIKVIHGADLDPELKLALKKIFKK